MLILYQRSVKNSYYEKIGDNIRHIDDLPFEIAHGWEWCRLGDIVRVVSGVSYDKQEIGCGEIRIIRGGNVDDLEIQLFKDDVFLPQKYYDDEKQVKKGDVVVVASTGSKVAIGRAGFAKENIPNTQIGAFLRIVRPICNDLIGYIRLIFASDYYRNHIRDMVHGNTINNIKNEYIGELLIPVPPLDEQIKITKCCGDLFAIIQNIEKGLN